jgi:hypothetical protein
LNQESWFSLMKRDPMTKPPEPQADSNRLESPHATIQATARSQPGIPVLQSKLRLRRDEERTRIQ